MSGSREEQWLLQLVEDAYREGFSEGASSTRLPVETLRDEARLSWPRSESAQRARYYIEAGSGPRPREAD